MFPLSPPFAVDPLGSSALQLTQEAVRRGYYFDGTMFFEAIETEDMGLLRALIANGLHPNVGDSHESTPLMYAVVLENFEAVQMLVAARANIEVQDIDGYTPLILAALTGNTAIEAYLRMQLYHQVHQANDN